MNSMLFVGIVIGLVVMIYSAGWMTGRYYLSRLIKDDLRRSVEISANSLEMAKELKSQAEEVRAHETRIRSMFLKYTKLLDDLKKVAEEWGEKQEDPKFSQFIQGLPWMSMSTYTMNYSEFTRTGRTAPWSYRPEINRG